MTILSEWAKRHGVSEQALEELRDIAGVRTELRPGERAVPMLSEAGVQARVRLEFARQGGALWRNNVGAMFDPERNTFVRFGLANESKQMNDQIKSHDLIGIRPVKISQSMVGSVIGQFVSREVKRSDWRYTGTPREVAQLKWAELILAMGGDATFTTGVTECDQT